MVFNGSSDKGLLLFSCITFFSKIISWGFLGVDVFFTFFSLLITALLIDEFSQSKNRASSWLRRRFYRIVPLSSSWPLVVMPLTF